MEQCTNPSRRRETLEVVLVIKAVRLDEQDPRQELKRHLGHDDTGLARRTGAVGLDVPGDRTLQGVLPHLILPSLDESAEGGGEVQRLDLRHPRLHRSILAQLRGREVPPYHLIATIQAL